MVKFVIQGRRLVENVYNVNQILNTNEDFEIFVVCGAI